LIVSPFGSVGGYIAGSHELIQFITATSFASIHDTSMSVPCAQQVIHSLTIILGEDNSEDGSIRLKRLKENSNYFRTKLLESGFIVFGDQDSPVVPIMLYFPTKMAAFCRLCLDENIGCVVASYPAIPLLSSRARFCISASHTIPELEHAVQSLVKIGDMCLLRYHKNSVRISHQQDLQPNNNQQMLCNDSTNRTNGETINYIDHLNCYTTTTIKTSCGDRILNGERNHVVNGKSNFVPISANGIYHLE